MLENNALQARCQVEKYYRACVSPRLAALLQLVNEGVFAGSVWLLVVWTADCCMNTLPERVMD